MANAEGTTITIVSNDDNDERSCIHREKETMMSQGRNPLGRLREMVGGAGAVAAAAACLPVQDEERRKILCDQARTGMLLRPGKVAFLKKICDSKAAILVVVDDNDQTDLHAKLNARYFRRGGRGSQAGLISSHRQINEKRNEELANIIIELVPYMCALRVKLSEQSAARRGTGSSTFPTLTSLVDEFTSIMRRVDELARAARQSEAASRNAPLQGLVPSATQLSRQYARNLMPTDPAYQQCPFCDHLSVNKVPESEDFEEKNRIVYQNHSQRMAVWNPYLDSKKAAERAGRNPPPPPRDPLDPSKIMTRKPREPGATTLAQLSMQCKCYMSRCAMRGDDTGSTCIILCRQVDVRTCLPAAAVQVTRRFPWDAANGCECPICNCMCNKMFNPKDTQKIMLARVQEASVQGQPGQSPALQLQSFLSRAFTGATATSVAAARLPNSTDETSMEYFVDSASELIARTGSSLPTRARSFLRKGLGQTTRVTLPNGSTYDTRALGTQNSHGSNNGLSTSGPQSAFSQGTATSLVI